MYQDSRKRSKFRQKRKDLLHIVFVTNVLVLRYTSFWFLNNGNQRLRVKMIANNGIFYTVARQKHGN